MVYNKTKENWQNYITETRVAKKSIQVRAEHYCNLEKQLNKKEGKKNYRLVKPCAKE